MRAINVFLALLVSAAIALLVFEGGLRLIGKGPQKTLVQYDPHLGWSKKPNYQLRRKGPDFDVLVRTNAEGLHDDARVSTQKPAGTFRVVMLGDSFVQGYSVQRQDLFVDLLERWWQAEGRQVEVINAGTEGYDMAQSVAWLEQHGAAYEPDLVLLFPYENDLYWNAQPHYESANGSRDKPRYLPDGSLEQRELVRPRGTGGLARTAVGGLFIRGPKGDPERHQFQPAGSNRRISKEFGPLLVDEPAFMSDVRAHTLGTLLALRRKTDELGAEALVVPIPGQTLYDPDAHARMTQRLGVPREAWSPNRPVDLVLSLAQEAGLAALDPRAHLTEEKAAGVQLYHQRDWHFGPEGNRAFATFLHGELDRREGVFPASHAAQREVALALPPVQRAGMPSWLPLYGLLWAILTGLYLATYRDEPAWRPPLAIALLLGTIFAIVLGVQALAAALPPAISQTLILAGVLAILGFIAYKLGRRLATIAELFRSFVLRGHWYLMPLVVVLLTVGSLLVVAASSPLVAPFIYTLF